MTPYNTQPEDCSLRINVVTCGQDWQEARGHRRVEALSEVGGSKPQGTSPVRKQVGLQNLTCSEPNTNATKNDWINYSQGFLDFF